MTAHTLSIIEQLDPNNLEDHYDLDFKFADQHITIDLHFDHTTIDGSRLEMLKRFITNIEAFDRDNKEQIRQDYADDNCDTVKTYLEYFIQNNDEEELASFTDKQNQDLNIEQQLLTQFKLVRLGLSPHEDRYFATFDYTISRELTDNLLVLFTNQLGDMDYMTLES